MAPPNPQYDAPHTAALRPAAAQPEHGYRNQETGGLFHKQLDLLQYQTVRRYFSDYCQQIYKWL